jgi:hypothetical protein
MPNNSAKSTNCNASGKKRVSIEISSETRVTQGRVISGFPPQPAVAVLPRIIRKLPIVFGFGAFGCR